MRLGHWARLEANPRIPFSVLFCLTPVSGPANLRPLTSQFTNCMHLSTLALIFAAPFFSPNRSPLPSTRPLAEKPRATVHSLGGGRDC